MNYSVKSLKFFKQQFDRLDKKSQKIIFNKIQSIKENTYRNKKIHSKSFSKVFRVRLNLNKKETRLIYVLLSSNIVLVCLLDRKKDYKDLEKYLSKIN